MYPAYWTYIWITLSKAIGASPLYTRQANDPASDGRPDCTTYSFSYPLWRVYDPIWILVNRTTGGTNGDFWFTAHNLATNIQVECEIKNSNLFPETDDDSKYWHACKDSATQFRFSLLTNEFQLRQSWVCDNSPRQVFPPHCRWVTNQ
jgi:hypothetical protein